MHPYLRFVKRKLNANSAQLSGLFRRRTTRLVSAFSLLTLFIMPSVMLGWWYLAAAAPNGAPQAHVVAKGDETMFQNGTPLGIVSITSSPVEPAAGDTNDSQSVTTQLRVNGQLVPVPQNGTVHKEIHHDNGGSTSVDVASSSATTGSSQTSSHMNIKVNSHSESATAPGP